MNVSKEIILICEVLGLTETELGSLLGVSYETINNWKHDRRNIDKLNIDKLYSFAYKKGIRFNRIYEQLIKEDYEDTDDVILFHGARKELKLPIDFTKFSEMNNDFGKGFYLGENYIQALNSISMFNTNAILAFNLNLKGLKVYKFNVDDVWMIAIAYFRGWLSDYENHEYITNLLKQIEDSDVIIAPIADNRMFDIISEFAEVEITDEQCRHALSSTNLGYQYVLKSEEALKACTFIQEMFVCGAEKKDCANSRIEQTNVSLQKVKMARIEYKNKGKYIEELLK